MNRAALHFALFTAALTAGAALWFAEPGSTDVAGDGLKEKPARKPGVRNVDHWQAYRWGHDWLETNLPATGENRLADNAARFRVSRPASVDCAEPGCRVCQWDRLFGGEW